MTPQCDRSYSKTLNLSTSPSMATTHTQTDKPLEDFSAHNLTGESFSRLLFEGCKNGAVAASLFAESDSKLFLSSPLKVSCFEKSESRIEMGLSRNFDSEQKSGSLNEGDCGSKRTSKSDGEKKNAVARVKAEGSGGTVGAPVEEDGSRCEDRKAKTCVGANGNRKRVRRRGLGGGVAVLQRLVCPNGKTDAATVLHEATGYIRFLQEQVKVLCFFYLQSQILSDRYSCDDGRLDECKDSPEEDLRSKGLCLVPMEYITDSYPTLMGLIFNPSP